MDLSSHGTGFNIYGIFTDPCMVAFYGKCREIYLYQSHGCYGVYLDVPGRKLGSMVNGSMGYDILPINGVD